VAIDTQISELDPASVADIEETLAGMLSAQYPNLDMYQGTVLRDLLIRPAAIFHALNDANIEVLRRSQSLVELEAHPEEADDETLDALAANFLTTRRTGTAAVGQVAVVLSAKVTTAVIAGTVLLSAAGRRYVVPQTTTGVLDESLAYTPLERVLQPSGANYVFTVDVQAEEDGADGRATRNTTFTFEAAEPANFVRAYAVADFTGGTDEESVTDLVARLRSGITAQIPSGRAHTLAWLTGQFPEIVDMSIIGAQDAEMRRDAHNVFGVSTLGKVDVLVRTRDVPLQSTLLLEATLMDAGLQRWQIVLPRSVAAGLYTIDAIRHADANELGSLDVISETRSADLSELTYAPLVTDAEAVYTAFQTITVLFEDPNTPTADLVVGQSTQVYEVVVSGMPSVSEIQALLLDRSYRPAASDWLVKAAIPCFVSVSFAVERHPDDPAINADELAAAAAAAVNAARFKHGRISTSDIARAVEALLPDNSSICLPIQMVGRLRQPDGTILTAASQDFLRATENLDQGISIRTVSFFCRPEDVSVDVRSLPVLEV